MSTWPSLVRAYIAGINEALGVRAAISAPSDVGSLPAFIRVTQGPGDDDTIFESSLLDFDVITPDYDTSERLAGQLRDWVLSTQNRLVGGVPIGRVRTGTSPLEVDWGNPSVSRFVYTARISTRRP